VQAQHRETEKPHRVVATQRALRIDVDAKVFFQRPNSPDPNAIRVTCVDAIEPGAAEPSSATIELERTFGIHLGAKHDERITALATSVYGKQFKRVTAR
jgi:hypothetical protein